MIKTENLVLDNFKDENEEAVIDILRNQEVKSDYICYDLDAEGLSKRFKQLKLDSKIKIHYARAVFKEDVLIAIINDTEIEDNKAEIELAILPEYRKVNLITEILKAVTDELLNKKGLDEVNAYCFARFAEYKEALEAAGFAKLEKETTLTYRGDDVLCLFYSKKK